MKRQYDKCVECLQFLAGISIVVLLCVHQMPSFICAVLCATMSNRKMGNVLCYDEDGINLSSLLCIKNTRIV